MIPTRRLALMGTLLMMMPAALAAPSVEQWEGNRLAKPTKHNPMPSKRQHALARSPRSFAAVIPVTPVLSGLSYGMAPPGATLTITGSNFSPDWKDNQVFFNDVPAQITASAPNFISVLVPQWNFGTSQLGVAVRVLSRGVPSTNSLKFDIGAKYLLPDQM